MAADASDAPGCGGDVRFAVPTADSVSVEGTIRDNGLAEKPAVEVGRKLSQAAKLGGDNCCRARRGAPSDDLQLTNGSPLISFIPYFGTSSAYKPGR